MNSILAAMISVSALFAGSHGQKKGADIVDTAIEAGSFNTLVAAVKAAGLVETLKGDGPFTVFAPTDEAFANLPAGTVEALLKPENKDKLTAILTYHVVPGKVDAGQVVNLDQAKTVNGDIVKIRVSDGTVFINDSRVVKTDIITSNGIIHVIDAVLIPGEDTPAQSGAMNLIETAISRGVPLYNNGQTAACAAIYEITARALFDLDENLTPSDRETLAKAINDIRHSSDNSDRAWILRRGLDHVYNSLQREMMTNL